MRRVQLRLEHCNDFDRVTATRSGCRTRQATIHEMLDFDRQRFNQSGIRDDKVAGAKSRREIRKIRDRALMLSMPSREGGHV